MSDHTPDTTEWERLVLSRPGAPERVAQIEGHQAGAVAITMIREAAGLSIVEAAERSGLTYEQITSMELHGQDNGHPITVERVITYARSLGVAATIHISKPPPPVVAD